MGKLSLEARESGVDSLGRSAVSPESLEVEFCAVIPRGRRTPADVRRTDRWCEHEECSEVHDLEAVAVEPGREWVLLLAAVIVSPTRLARSAEISEMVGMAWCRASEEM